MARKNVFRTTRRRSFALCLGAVVLAVACAHTEPTFTTRAESAAKNPARKGQVVRIDDGSVFPSEARIEAGGSVTWTNDSSLRAVVRFPSAIEGKLTCKGPLRPDWQLVADGIESIPVGQEDVVFPCSLEPGIYPYEISMFRGHAGMDNPQYQLKASLRVE